MLVGIDFRDEQDKQELVDMAMKAKETVCDLWEKMAEHMPELRQIQERSGRYRGYGMGNPGGWNGNVGYRNYGGGSNYGGGYGPQMGAPMMDGYPMFRENPGYMGGNDRRGY